MNVCNSKGQFTYIYIHILVVKMYAEDIEETFFIISVMLRNPGTWRQNVSISNNANPGTAMHP